MSSSSSNPAANSMLASNVDERMSRAHLVGARLSQRDGDETMDELQRALFAADPMFSLRQQQEIFEQI